MLGGKKKVEKNSPNQIKESNSELKINHLILII